MFNRLVAHVRDSIVARMNYGPGRHRPEIIRAQTQPEPKPACNRVQINSARDQVTWHINLDEGSAYAVPHGRRDEEADDDAHQLVAAQ